MPERAYAVQGGAAGAGFGVYETGGLIMGSWAKFRSDYHRECYQQLLAQVKVHPENQEWTAALYVLAATEKRPADILRCISNDNMLDLDGLRDLAREPQWSRGEKRLVQLAVALLSREPADHMDLYALGDMDDKLFEVSIIALRRLNGRSKGALLLS